MASWYLVLELCPRVGTEDEISCVYCNTAQVDPNKPIFFGVLLVNICCAGQELTTNIDHHIIHLHAIDIRVKSTILVPSMVLHLP